ncbi:serine O-acetyltransferase [Arthrobacter sp. STN4]|uniref:serine O-acetyltransferase n=1 Tax=Arthrobacter sp. STN4 TaxID=2923276 RepID=UPI00277B5BEC|nr:serine acetyltransferase [Arthrobacter sp. STN4]
MKLMDDIRADFAANRSQTKGRLVVVAYRLANAARGPRGKRPTMPAKCVGVLYRICVEWLLGVEIPWGTQIGVPLRLYHGVGIVINDQSVIGRNVGIRQNVTIGNKGTSGPCPVFGDNVEIGAGAIILGGVQVGDGARIGAGAVVTKDVPAGFTAMGNPAKLRAPR